MDGSLGQLPHWITSRGWGLGSKDGMRGREQRHHEFTFSRGLRVIMIYIIRPAPVHYTLCVASVSGTATPAPPGDSASFLTTYLMVVLGSWVALEPLPDMSNSFTGLFIYLFRSPGGIYCHTTSSPHPQYVFSIRGGGRE